MYRIYGLLIALLIVWSCTRTFDPSRDPRRSLSDYISLSFSVKNIEDKSRLMVFLTADVKSRLAGWSEEQFREAFVESKREFIKLLFKEVKDVSPTEVEITYELSYLDHGK